MKPLGVGVIGAGVISHAYLGTICRSPVAPGAAGENRHNRHTHPGETWTDGTPGDEVKIGPDLRLIAVSSRGGESARQQAARYGGSAMTTEALLAHPEVEVVVNLAPPSEHHRLGRAVLEAGKHLYSEKPFATSLEDAQDLVALAAARGLTIGCAPDTFLGPAHQATRRLIDQDAIGRVVGGAVVMASAGMESWHPDPAFFYARGGGPLLDIGPYLVTQLVNLLGPIRSVSAIGSRPRETRTITSPERAGQTIGVEVATTVNGALLFDSGANVAITLSWDVPRHQRNAIELYGLKGSLIAPTPNSFDGEVRISDGGDWRIVHTAEPGGPPPAIPDFVAALQALKRGVDPMTGGALGPGSPPLFGDRRGLGLVEMARAVRERRVPRASGALALHVLEVLLALETCAEEGGSRDIASRVDRPEPLEGPL